MSRGILTIDDAASKNTPAIVDYLCKKNIKALFFAVGKNLEKYPEEAAYILKKGFEIGNHGYSHIPFSKMTKKESIVEIERTDSLLEKLYEKSGRKKENKFFRFPYLDKGGASRDFLQEYLKSKGYKALSEIETYSFFDKNNINDIDISCTFDIAEYNIRPGNGLDEKYVFERLNDLKSQDQTALFSENSRHIVLLHAHDETEEILPEYYKIFLDYITGRGFIFDPPRFD